VVKGHDKFIRQKYEKGFQVSDCEIKIACSHEGI
jgi:hypothetical protein